MNKKTAALTVVVGLLFSALTGILAVNDVAANFLPEQPPAGIRIGGSGVEGTNLIQQSGNTYILTGNINQTIVIMADNIVLDGAGYTLQGNGSGTGVFLQAKTGVKINNLQVTGFSYGVRSTWYYHGSDANLNGNTISDCTFTGNSYGIYIGDFSSGNNLTGNNLSGNTYGIYLSACSNSYLRGNKMTNNNFNFFVSGGTVANSVNDVDQSNTVDGKPIIYWLNKQGQTVPADAGYIALVNCSKMTIQNMDLSHNGQAILLANVTDSTIKNNKVTQNHNGIWLVESENNKIEQNTFADNTYSAMYISNSNSNVIESNSFVGNGLSGTPHAQVLGSVGQAAIWLIMCSNNQIENNQLTGNGEGINLQSSGNNIISGNVLENTEGSTVIFFACVNNTVKENTITGNNGPGIEIWSASQTIVYQNNISNNSLGILLDGAKENSIYHNNINDNKGFGMQLKSASVAISNTVNNNITQNNFIDNQPDGLDVSIPGTMMDMSPELVAGPSNTWENNYWSDYQSRYPNATEIAGTGVGDTPYFINENNIDYKPLLLPVQISGGTQPSLNTQEPTGNSPPSGTQEPTGNAQQTPSTMQLTAATAIIVAIAGGGLLIYRKQHPTKTEKNAI